MFILPILSVVSKVPPMLTGNKRPLTPSDYRIKKLITLITRFPHIEVFPYRYFGITAGAKSNVRYTEDIVRGSLY